MKKRHDVDEEFNGELDNIEDDEIFKHGDKSIIYIFTTVPGTLILISFVVFLFIFIAIDNVNIEINFSLMEIRQKKKKRNIINFKK